MTTTTTKAERPRHSRGGMAALAGDLANRTNSLARASTEDGLVPAVELVSDSPKPAPVQAVKPAAQASVVPAPHAAEPAVPSSSAEACQTRQTARPMAGPEGRLEASGEIVVKWTLELAPQLIMALNIWERDETKRLGQRVYRERMVDLALDSLPEDVGEILKIVADLPQPLRIAPGQQFGTRVRSSVRDKLLGLRPELRVAGIKNVRIRDIYSAGVYRYLTGLDIEVENGAEKAINPEVQKPS